ncbi:MAG: M20 family metallopeptidase [Trueperaceae bacterium]|nr:M20 family metallopeptidase [Trueperaceae bacterium]
MTHPLRDAAHQCEAAFLKTLEDLVRLESPTQHKPSADTLADYLETQLRADNWEVERVQQTAVGDQIIARMVAANDGPKTLLLTHYDTVWPLGTLAEMPFRRDDNKVYGPGVLDMKAGIAVAMHAPALAKALGRPLEGLLTLLVTSDEETGSAYSRELIETLAQEHDRVLVLEPGRDDGALKVGRKGVGNFYATFTGQSAHAGNNPDDGASALRELAHYLLFAESLNDKDAETTVNVTVARGGTVSNVIAEKATATADMRVMQQSEAERVEAALRGYEPKDSRVSVEITGGLNRPPLELTDANRALFEKAQAAMDDLGFELAGAVVGGGSDGSFTSALGIATLDGLGSSGQGPHARHEHIRVAETLDRLALVTALITDAPASS